MIKTTCQVALLALLVGSVVSCTMWKKPASGWAGATGGEQLEKLFWEDVKSKNWADLDRRLASTFAAVATNGTMDRAAFLQKLHGLNVAEVNLANCNSQLNGGDLMVTCVRDIRADSAVPPASTLSVWQQVKKGWIMVAHSETPLENKAQ